MNAHGYTDDGSLLLAVRYLMVATCLISGGSACRDAHPLTPSAATPATSPPTPQSSMFIDDPKGFQAAVGGLGTHLVITFDDVDAGPTTDSIEGRPRFDGLRYSDNGAAFSNPNNVPLYIAPGGLFWNPSNSLSIGRFPFDPLPQSVDAPYVEDDDLVMTFQPACIAVAFSIIDSDFEAQLSEEVVEFFDSEAAQIRKVGLPRFFIGLVSPTRRISRVSVSEAAADGDDVTYDDVVCVR